MSEIPRVEDIQTSIETSEVAQSPGELGESIENPDLTQGFDLLEKNYEKQKVMKEFMTTFSDYMDFKLDNNLSQEEKNNIKLVLVGELIKDFKLSTIVQSTVVNLFKPVKEILLKLKVNQSTGQSLDTLSKSMKDVSNNFNGLLDSLGLGDKVAILENKIAEINKKAKDKQKGDSFKTLNGVLDVLSPERQGKKSEKEIFNDTKAVCDELSVKMGKGEEAGDYVREAFNGLSRNFRESIRGFLKGFVDKFPILGLLFGLFLGKDFFKEGIDNSIDSVNNLKSFVSDEKFPLKENIKPEDGKLKNLDPKDLEYFFKFLDGKEIDYSSDTFWKELLTGDSKNDYIKGLNMSLIGENKNILKSDEGIEDLVKKLNNLAEQESIRENKEKTKAAAEKVETSKQEHEIATATLTTAKTKLEEARSAKNIAEKALSEAQIGGEAMSLQTQAILPGLESTLKQKEKDLEIAKKQVEEAKRDTEVATKVIQDTKFESSLETVGINKKVIFEGKEYNIGFEGNNTLILGDSKYKIKLLATEHDNMEILKRIGFDGEKIEFEYRSGLLTSEKKEMNASMLKDIISTLILGNKGYDKKIDGQPAELKITQIV